MGFLALHPGSTNSLLTAPSGGWLPFAQWVIDFDNLPGSTLDFYLDMSSALRSGGEYAFRLLLGGTVDTNDGTLLCSGTIAGGTTTLAESSLAVAMPTGPQLVKLMYEATTGDGGDVRIRGVTIHLGNTQIENMICLNYATETGCGTGNTLVATFAVSPDALPGSGNLTYALSFYANYSDGVAGYGALYDGGTLGEVDGEIRASVSAFGSGLKSTVSAATRPSSTIRFKICATGVGEEQGFNMIGATILIIAS